MKILELKSLIVGALNVSEEDIANVQSFGGMTNINFRVSVGDENYVVRLPGYGTEEFINRSHEDKNLAVGAKLGINPETLYFNVETGLKITRMIPEAETLTPRAAKKEATMKMVTEVLRTLHDGDIPLENKFDLFNLMEDYEQIANRCEVTYYEGFHETKQAVMEIVKQYNNMSFIEKPCHIDPLQENFIKSGDDKLYLIDWEYAGMFDPHWDLAAHSVEAGFTPLEEELFLNHYFKGDVQKETHQRILMHKIFQDYLWSIWTLFKEAKGDNFGTYGQDRFDRLVQNIKEYNEAYQEEIVS